MFLLLTTNEKKMKAEEYRKILKENGIGHKELDKILGRTNNYAAQSLYRNNFVGYNLLKALQDILEIRKEQHKAVLIRIKRELKKLQIQQESED